MKLARLHAREILDSKGHPTLEVEATLSDGSTAVAGVPSGASTGESEAFELRDQDQSRYQGKGVLQAVDNVNGPLTQVVKDLDPTDQIAVDQALLTADGTDNKSKYGGNAILGVSMAMCKAAAQAQHLQLYEYFGQLIGNHQFTLPQPMILVLEGGKHGHWATDIQEFMVVPKETAFATFADRLRVGADIFHSLEKVLVAQDYSTGVGYEGAFAPREITSNQQALELITQAVDQAGYQLGSEVVLAIDVAAAEFYHQGKYVLRSENDLSLTAEDWGQRLLGWADQYHLWSIEDPFDEEAWQDWPTFTAQAKQQQLQVVGDDLLTTNVKRIQRGIDSQAMNSVLIKVNQIGTITETLQSIKVSQEAGLSTIISHRAGETTDDLIADLAVGTNAGQVKFGGPDRGERLAKYNRLLRIEEQLQTTTK